MPEADKKSPRQGRLFLCVFVLFLQLIPERKGQTQLLLQRMQAGDFPPDQHFIIKHMVQDICVFQHFVERRLDVFLVAVALNSQCDLFLLLWGAQLQIAQNLSLIHISEPTRQAEISYAVFCLKKKKNK